MSNIPVNNTITLTSYLPHRLHWMSNFRTAEKNVEVKSMMTSSNERVFFRVTDPLWEEFTGDQWIPLTKASDAELWCLSNCLSKRGRRRWFETPSRPLWRHYKAINIRKSLSQLATSSHWRELMEIKMCFMPRQNKSVIISAIPAWVSNYIDYEVWGEITYPFLNVNGAAVEVWEWLSNFFPHFTGRVIPYPFLE